MGFFDIFKKRKINYNFDEKDREISSEIRRKNAEIKQKEQELKLKTIQLEQEIKQRELELKLAELESQFEEDSPDVEENNPDSMLMAMMAGIMQNKQQSPISENKPVVQELNLSEEQIKEMVDKIPKMYRKIANTWNDEQLTNFIKGQIPNISNNSISIAIQYIRA